MHGKNSNFQDECLNLDGEDDNNLEVIFFDDSTSGIKITHLRPIGSKEFDRLINEFILHKDELSEKDPMEIFDLESTDEV